MIRKEKLVQARTERMVIEEIAKASRSGLQRHLAKAVLKSIPERFSTSNLTPSMSELLTDACQSLLMEGDSTVEDLFSKLKRDVANFPDFDWSRLFKVEEMYAELERGVVVDLRKKEQKRPQKWRGTPSFANIFDTVMGKRKEMKKELLSVQKAFALFLGEQSELKKIISEKFGALLETCTNLIQEVVRAEQNRSLVSSAVEKGLPEKLVITLNQFKKMLLSQSYTLSENLSVDQLKEVSEHLKIVQQKILESQEALKEFSSKMLPGM